MGYKHLKHKCAGCERTNIEMNEEHVFPRWLILRTNTHKTKIRWFGENKINALSATLPLCIECNRDFGSELENSVSQIFSDLESNKGISDNDAELLIRWLWKLDGMFWIAFNPNRDYSPAYTLRQRVLQPLDEIRGQLILAISLINSIDPSFGDLPLGLDSYCTTSGIFVAGVFSKIAIMVAQEIFENMIPSNYSKLRMKKIRDPLSDSKLFYPKTGFSTDVEAVGISVIFSRKLSYAHDLFAEKANKI